MTEEADTTTAAAGAAESLRKITDAGTLRALAHPVRLAIIEQLSINGPLTATEVGEAIGESPTTCSFHLRQLAKYDFVEEAGGGSGRSRPWKMRSIGMQMSSNTGDAAADLAANVVGEMFRERSLERYRAWWSVQRVAYPARWRKAAGDSEYVIYMTADELERLNEELLEKLVPLYRDRLTDPSARPPGAVPVELLLFSYPIALPEGDD